MNVAVIPARFGSKRIPKKNIKLFCGKPMIAWPIEIALKSKLFDHVIVSTDCEKIASIANSYGAETPFIRPAKLSNDFATTTEVISHAANWMLDKNWKIFSICCIYPTSVFLNVEDLLKGLKIFSTNKWSYVFSVTEFEYPIFRSFKESKNGGVEMFFPENFDSRSQDLPIAFHDAAQFYWGKTDAWINKIKIFDKHSFPIKIPRWRIQDIDTKDDFDRAQNLFKLISKS